MQFDAKFQRIIQSYEGHHLRSSFSSFCVSPQTNFGPVKYMSWAVYDDNIFPFFVNFTCFHRELQDFLKSWTVTKNDTQDETVVSNAGTVDPGDRATRLAQG